MKLFFKGQGDAAGFYTPLGQAIVDKAGAELSDLEANFILKNWPNEVEKEPEPAETPKGEHDAQNSPD